MSTSLSRLEHFVKLYFIKLLWVRILNYSQCMALTLALAYWDRLVSAVYSNHSTNLSLSCQHSTDVLLHTGLHLIQATA